MATEPRLRLAEIIDHAQSIINQYQNQKRVRKRILDLMHKELLEAKKIIIDLPDMEHDIKKLKEDFAIVLQEIELLKKIIKN